MPGPLMRQPGSPTMAPDMLACFFFFFFPALASTAITSRYSQVEALGRAVGVLSRPHFSGMRRGMGCGPRWTAAGTGGLGVQGQDGGQGRCSIAEGEAGGAVQKARAMWTASRVRMCGELAETGGGQGCIAHKPPSSSDPLFDLPVPPAAAKDRLCCTRVAVHVHPTSRTPATVGRGHLREERFASHHSLQSQTHWQAAGERRSHEEEEEQEQAAETAVAGASDPDASIMHRARFARERFVSGTARACKKISCWRQSLFFFRRLEKRGASERSCERQRLGAQDGNSMMVERQRVPQLLLQVRA